MRYLLISVVLLLSACASLVGPRTVEVPLEKMQQQVDKAFPREQRMLAIFKVRLSQPRLQLTPANDSLRVKFMVEVEQALSGHQWQGELALEGHLVLDTERQLVKLADVRPTSLSVNGRGRIDVGLDAPFLDRLARDLVLYQFKPDELRRAGVQFQPQSLRVNANSISLSFAPQ